MKNFLSTALFTLVVSLLYTGVAQFLPQLENHPPANAELGSDIGPDELAPIGAEVFAANCLQCHKAGEATRAPDISGIGSQVAIRAAARSTESGEKYTGVDYLVEALCKPGDYLVEGFGNIMPPQGKVLSGGQILAVVAYLQEQGGTATVKGTDVEPIKRFDCVVGGGAGGGEGPQKKVAVGPPAKVYEKFGCSGCHATDGPERKIGPSLHDVGKRLSKGLLYEALLDPDGTLAAGDPPYAAGVMAETLKGNGFYDQMTPADFQALVDWLAGLKG
jgi:mono/diheme cytochrome c family protein